MIKIYWRQPVWTKRSRMPCFYLIKSWFRKITASSAYIRQFKVNLAWQDLRTCTLTRLSRLKGYNNNVKNINKWASWFFTIYRTGEKSCHTLTASTYMFGFKHQNPLCTSIVWLYNHFTITDTSPYKTGSEFAPCPFKPNGHSQHVHFRLKDFCICIRI